jgi:P-type Mg2+ transporter
MFGSPASLLERVLPSRLSAALALGAIAVVAIAVALPYTWLAAPLGFVPLPPALLLAIAGVTCAYVACTEAAKRLLHRHDGRRRASRAD